MKTYIVIEYQTGGCDYTIGCGYRITTFKAKNWKEAVDIVLTKEGDDYPGEFLLDERHWKPRQRIVSWFREDEGGANHVMLVEAAHFMGLDGLILERRAEIAKEKDEAASKKKEEAERKEFERLKKKFGDV